MKNLSIFFIFSILTAFLLAGCSGLVNNDSEPCGKTYIMVGSASTDGNNSSRTIFPDTKLSSLTDVKLSGLKKGQAAEAKKELASAQTFLELMVKPIEITAGDWTFTLTALLNGVEFSGSTEKTIEAGKTTSLSFELTTTESKGGINLTVNFEGKAAKAFAMLYDSNREQLEEPLELTVTPTVEGGTVTYTKANSDGLSGLEAGTYIIEIDFYADENASLCLNSYSELVRIAPGYTSSAVRSFSLNESYNIEYHCLYNGEEGEFPDLSDSLPLVYSRRTGGVFPPEYEMRDYSYHFAGWFTDESLKTEAEDISQESSGDKVFYAAFFNSFTIKEDGDDSNCGTPDYPLKSIDAAVGKIKDFVEKEMNYTIVIDGEVKGSQSISNDVTGKAGGITITGKSENYLNDILNGNGEGSVLTIDTAVPVTINYIKIEGGVSSGSGVGSGIHLGSNTGNFIMGGEVFVDAANDIYLPDDKTITIFEPFEGNVLNKITPGSYDRTTPMLKDDDMGIIASEYKAFSVSNDASGEDWYIGIDAKLRGSKYIVGDIILNDGTYVPYGTAIDDGQKLDAVAVIFYAGKGLNNKEGGTDDTNTFRMLGIALHESEKILWYETTSKIAENNGVYGCKEIGTIICTPSGSAGNYTFNSKDNEYRNGSDCLERISTYFQENNIDDDTENETMYPALHYAKNYNPATRNSLDAELEGGWYIPTVAELFELWRIKSTVSPRIASCNGTGFDNVDGYFSSSLCAGGAYLYPCYVAFKAYSGPSQPGAADYHTQQDDGQCDASIMISYLSSTGYRYRAIREFE